MLETTYQKKSEQKPINEDYPTNVERNLFSKSTENEFNYYWLLLDISTLLKLNEHLLIKSGIDEPQKVLSLFRSTLSDLVPTNYLQKSTKSFDEWFGDTFKNLKDEEIYTKLKEAGDKLFKVAFDSYQNKRVEEDLQNKLRANLRNK